MQRLPLDKGGQHGLHGIGLASVLDDSATWNHAIVGNQLCYHFVMFLPWKVRREVEEIPQNSAKADSVRSSRSPYSTVPGDVQSGWPPHHHFFLFFLHQPLQSVPPLLYSARRCGRILPPSNAAYPSIFTHQSSPQCFDTRPLFYVPSWPPARLRPGRDGREVLLLRSAVTFP